MRTGGILTCLLLTALTAAGHYVVLIPSELRTDCVEKVCVLLLPPLQSPHLTLTIQNIETNSTILQKELPTSTPFSCISFTIGESEMSPHSYNTLLSVSVKGSGENLSVNETKMVVLKRYDSLTFVQTDKPVYKPGQIVKFRIVTLNDRFIPVQEEYPLVTVWDPEGNRIGQWKDLTPRQGIVDLTYDLMPEPMQGSYRIEVQKKQGKVEHSFSVEEYVLPTAELTVKMPGSIMMTDPVIHLEVCGRYTYGKPVKGSVNGTVCLQSYNYFSPVRYCEHVDGKTDANGCLVKDLSTKTFKFVERLFTDQVRASFIMVESGTGLHLTASGETNVKPEITKITFEGVEDYYKKGLPYSGQIRMQYSTGGPVRNASIFLFCSLKPGAEKLSTDENGVAPFSLDTTTWGSLPVSFTAIYQGGYLFQSNLPHHKSGHHTVKPFYSRSSSFLSIQKHHQELTCDSQLDVDIHYSITCPTVQEKASLDVFYLAMSRGLIVTLNQKTISVGGSEGSRGHFSLSFPIDADMSPFARLLVFAVLPDGETIGDSTKFQVQKCFRNEVSLHFSVPEDLPKSQITLGVNASPDSLCALRVVDRSVLLFKPEKELSRESVYSMLPVQDLSRHHYAVQENDEDFCRRQDPWAIPVSRDDVMGEFADILQDMGLKILTDTEYHRPIDCEMREPIMVSRIGGLSHGAPGQFNRLFLNSYPQNIPSIQVRKYFPETWIWELVPVGSSGSVSLPVTVPDSITEWKGSVFCTGQAGFGISGTVSLNAFKPFFVELVLPYSIVRTEGFTLKAKVFNYLKECILVKVSLLEAPGLNLTSESNVEHQTCVCSMDSVTISWQLIATGLGEQNLTVSAESVASDTPCGNEVVIVPEKGAIDIIRKPLLIKAEGDETELTHSSFLCPAGKTVTERLHLQLPEDVVEGSERADITVLGDIMSSAMENLDSLLRLPTGCGEQNMVKFAPNVYVQRYLNKTHQLTGEIQRKAIGYLRTGYQNQLKYKHSDGSFSAFGKSDPEGNTWLTAFVLKSFLQARPYIFIDEKIIREAASFFVTNRMESGCFASLGSLFNNAMKGGVDDHITLSAYVTSALLELGNNDLELADNILKNWFKAQNRQVSSESTWSAPEADDGPRGPTAAPLDRTAPDFKTEVTDRALKCLRDALETVNSTYSLSLLAYTFTLAQDQVTRDKILHHLEELAIKEDGLTHWRREQEPEEEHDYWWRASSAEVEMTAYVLLALLSQPQVPPSDLDRAIPIVRWLVKQRNSYGGFASTQDTVVALQALSLYAELIYVADPHSSVTVSSQSGFHQEFHIDSSNQLLLQSRPLPEVPGDYSAEISGTSCLLLQTSLRYNTPPKPKDAAFRVSVEMKNPVSSINKLVPGSEHKIEINVTYVGERPVTNMVLVDVAMISGFSPKKNSHEAIPGHGKINRAEINDGHLVLYLEPTEYNHLLRFSIRVVQDFEVENLQPAAVKVYDYYATDDSVVVEYEAPKGLESV